MRTWDEQKLLEILELVLKTGSASVLLPTPHDASRFRKALYNYRAARELAQDVILSITCEGASVNLSVKSRGPEPIILGASNG